MTPRRCAPTRHPRIIAEAHRQVAARTSTPWNVAFLARSEKSIFELASTAHTTSSSDQPLMAHASKLGWWVGISEGYCLGGTRRGSVIHPTFWECGAFCEMALLFRPALPGRLFAQLISTSRHVDGDNSQPAVRTATTITIRRQQEEPSTAAAPRLWVRGANTAAQLYALMFRIFLSDF